VPAGRLSGTLLLFLFSRRPIRARCQAIAAYFNRPSPVTRSWHAGTLRVRQISHRFGALDPRADLFRCGGDGVYPGGTGSGDDAGRERGANNSLCLTIHLATARSRSRHFQLRARWTGLGAGRSGATRPNPIWAPSSSRTGRIVAEGAHHASRTASALIAEFGVWALRSRRKPAAGPARRLT